MKTGLLVVDAQKIYTDQDSELFCEDSEATISRINKLINKFQNANLTIYYVRHVHKVDGSDIGHLFDFDGESEDDFNFKEGSEEVEYDDRLARIESAKEIIKTRYSAFIGTNLDQELKKEGIERVVICGFMTNFCCESTARNALDLDYYVDFVLDATGTPGTENMNEVEVRKTVGAFMESGFARVISVNDLVTQNL